MFKTIDILLALGLIGLMEMIIAGLNWSAIMQNSSLTAFRPGNIGAQISVLLILLGFVGFISFFVRIFNRESRHKTSRNILAFLFFSGFFAMAYLYQSV